MDKLTRYKILIDSIQSEIANAQVQLSKEDTIVQEHFAKFHLIDIQRRISNLLYKEEIEKIMSIEKEEIRPIPIDAHDLIKFAKEFHYNKTYDCNPSAIEKLEKALEYRQYIQNDELVSKIEEYTHNYYEHHNAVDYVFNNWKKIQYKLTVLIPSSNMLESAEVMLSKSEWLWQNDWEKIDDVPKYFTIKSYERIIGLLQRGMIAHATGDEVTRSQFYDCLIKMRKYNSDKHEWWQIYLGEEIGWKPLQFRVNDILFTR